jgi:hypothetical protein
VRSTSNRALWAPQQPDQLVKFDRTWLSRFCVFWIRNTIRNVTMVVLVLMTSYQYR